MQSSPTSVDDLRYDGAGTRIEQRTVSGGTTTTIYYLLSSQEEVQIFSGATTLTKNYPTGAGTHLPQPIKVGTTVSYLATDGLDTVSEALDSAGNVTAQQLSLPSRGSAMVSNSSLTGIICVAAIPNELLEIALAVPLSSQGALLYRVID